MARNRPDPHPDQARILDHADGAVLALGGPGTGKTWVLRERFARLVEAGEDPERVVLFTLTRRAAREAREWLVHRLGRSLPELPVFTAHGFAFRVVARRYRELDYEAPPAVLSAPEQYGVVREMLDLERQEDWPTFGTLLRVRRLVRDVADLVLRAQERLLDPEAMRKLVDATGRLEFREVTAFYQRYVDALAQSGQTDFGGLLFQTVALLQAGRTDEERFRHVMVDDYQDATLATEAILAALAMEARSLVVTADPGGHVFGYRGGTKEPLERAQEVLGSREVIRLSHSHRLRGRLTTLEGLASSGSRSGAEGAAVRSRPPELEARLLAHPGEEVEAVAHELEQGRVEEDVPWGAMAVILRRYGSYLTALRHALGRHGIPFVVVAESAELPSEPAVRPVVDLLRYALRPSRREELLEPLLTSPLVGLDPHALRRLRRVARQREVTLRQLVEAHSGAGLPEDLGPRVEAFRRLLEEFPRRAGGAPPDEVFFELWRGLPHFGRLVEASEASGEGGRDLDALAAFADVLSRFAERRRGAGIEDYLDALDAAEFGPDPWLPPEERHPDAVRIVSAHLAHGMEFELVMVAGCLEGEFPSLHGAEPTISLSHLVRPRSSWERLGDRLEEERALFRLAVSRARRRTVLFASRSTGSRAPRTPSRFAARLGVDWAVEDRSMGGTSLRALEAQLRKTVARRDGDPALRLAAAAALGRLGARPESWWGRRMWSDPGLPLHEGQILTSYSRLSTMDNCPLQYLFSVEMGLDPESTFQMWLGTLVHGIIDEVQRGELRADLEAMHAALDARWRKEVFPNRAVEHRRYLDAREMLRRWLEHEQHDAVRSEVWFEFPIDSAIVRGRIDAVFRQQNGHLRVVDYKTGRSYPTDEEAKRDLQLAAYYLALKRTPELAELGPPGILQLAYLGRPHSAGGFVRRQVSPKTIEGYDQWAEARMLELLDGVRAERFAPSPEADCQFCEFKTICPRWPEGEEVPIGAPAEGSGGRR